MKKGWQVKKLGEECEIDKLQGVHRGLPYVGLEHIESQTARFIGETTPQMVKSSTFRFSTRHVLYGRLRPYLNKALAPDFEGHCSTEIFPLKPSASLSRDYLLYWLLADETRERINGTCTGARMPRANMKEVMGFDFPLPPLPEQKRIVAILDEAFAAIAAAKAAVEKNLQNARVLFESHLNEVFTRKGKGWVEKRLGEICQIKTGKKDVNQGNPNGKFPFFTCAAAHTFSDSYSFDTEALLVAGNGNVGQVSYYSGKFEVYQRTYVLSGFKEVSAKYLFRVLDKRLSATVSKQKLGNTMPYIKMGMLTDYLVPIPPPIDQVRIADELDALSAATTRLAAHYARKLELLEELKKSLLHQAIAGEL